MLRDFINGLRREMKGENGFKIFSMVCLALETGSTSILTRWSRLLMRFFLTKWVVQGAVNVDIGANPSVEGGEDDEGVQGAVNVDIDANPSVEDGEDDKGVDDQAVKVVDIVDTFRLQSNQLLIRSNLLREIY